MLVDWLIDYLFDGGNPSGQVGAGRLPPADQLLWLVRHCPAPAIFTRLEEDAVLADRVCFGPYPDPAMEDGSGSGSTK